MPTDEPTDLPTDRPTDLPSGRSDLPELPDPAELVGLIRLFAEEKRVRAFAAVALGAENPTQVGERAGLSPKDTGGALRRLRDQGVIAEDAGRLGVAHQRFRELARAARPRTAATEDYGSQDERSETVLRTFVRDGRLVRLPSQWQRKLVVLRHIAERTFEPGVEYPERTVNEKLRAWCEDAPVDHVTLRRYLVDLHHLQRQDGFYWRPAATA
ncbi:DUF2087 domain-containing protein [Streptomyces krungchingensis]